MIINKISLLFKQTIFNPNFQLNCNCIFLLIISNLPSMYFKLNFKNLNKVEMFNKGSNIIHLSTLCIYLLF